MRILRVLAWVAVSCGAALMGAVGLRPRRYVGRHWQRRGGHRAVELAPGSNTMRLDASAVRGLRHRWTLRQAAKGTAEVKP